MIGRQVGRVCSERREAGQGQGTEELRGRRVGRRSTLENKTRGAVNSKERGGEEEERTGKMTRMKKKKKMMMMEKEEQQQNRTR